MKIIAVDNLNRETVADTLVAENVTEFYGQPMVSGLNAALCTDDMAPRFFRLVPDEYRLSRGMEDLV